MPVSLATERDPFRGVAPRIAQHTFRVPQMRVLDALMPVRTNDPPSEWPMLTQRWLNQRLGYSEISTGVVRPLRGIPVGSSSGTPHPGLLGLGWVEMIAVDVDGVTENNYRITASGVVAYKAFLSQGGKLPPKRNADVCGRRFRAAKKEVRV